MTFKWQGRTYDTANMKAFETANPAMPVIYVVPDGTVFVVEIDRVEGIEVRRADPAEVKVLADRYHIPELLNAANEAQAAVRGSHAGHSRCHALIVEDDGSSRHALSRLLHLSGYETSSAATISEAEAKLSDEPKWLILDLNLPDGEGTVLLKRVRSENLPIRVAITTAATDEAVLSEVSRLQPDAIFHKPFDMSEVMHWLDAA